MRKMFSKNQIKRLVEDDISGVTVTKGEYTAEAHVHITKVGHCVTITGSIEVDNTSGAPINNGLTIITINNINLDFADGQFFNGVHAHDTSVALTSAYFVSISGKGGYIIINNPVQTGSTYYYFDVDLIDGDDLPVLDYPGA